MEQKRNLAGLDYSGVELLVFQKLAQEGKFDNMEPKRTFNREEKEAEFSQIFGIRAGEIRSHITQTKQRSMTLNFLKAFKGAGMFIKGLRKSKSKAMLEALIHGHYDNGNHFMTCYENMFHFYYRGTLIARWDAVHSQTVGYVHAGAYEGTASTKNQRKEIEKAVAEFNAAIFSL